MAGAYPMGLKRLYGVFVLAVALLCSVAHGTGLPEEDAGASNNAVAVIVNDMATVKSDPVFLGDIAAIHTADRELKKKLEGLKIGNAPKPGHEQRISGHWVHSLVLSTIVSDTAPKVDIPDIIVIKRTFQSISDDQLYTLLSSYLEDEYIDSEVHITQFKVRGNNVFPEGAVSLDIVPGNRQHTGFVNVVVAVSVDNTLYGKLILSARADIYRQVVCARSFVKRGTVLTEMDVEMDKVNVSKASPDVILDMSEAIGKQVKNNLREGGYLRSSMLEIPPLIREGDKVKLVAAKGALSVVTMGVAKTAGPAGSQIFVENVTSGKVVVGRVKDHATVDVLF